MSSGFLILICFSLLAKNSTCHFHRCFLLYIFFPTSSSKFFLPHQHSADSCLPGPRFQKVSVTYRHNTFFLHYPPATSGFPSLKTEPLILELRYLFNFLSYRYLPPPFPLVIIITFVLLPLTLTLPFCLDYLSSSYTYLVIFPSIMDVTIRLCRQQQFLQQSPHLS